MGVNFNGPPREEDIEVSVIGTGGGYGECIILKMGTSDWAVIDSCIDPVSKEPLALSYLRAMGVDIVNDVKLIICTHWHDDHILGISQLLEQAKKATFVIGKVNDKEKFLQFVNLDYSKHTKSSNSTTVEFQKCLQILSEGINPLKFGLCDRLLFQTSIGDENIQLYSLSPSDLTVHEFDLEVSQLITEFGKTNKQIIINKPNDKSVALLLKFGKDDGVLLGADLEVSSNRGKGWCHIIEQSISFCGTKSSLFKIPHHGSQNGYIQEVWDSFLVKSPISKITPWNRGGKLPKDEMIDKYKSCTDSLYITSNSYSKKGKTRSLDRGLEKFIKDSRPSLEEVQYRFGLIQSRINMSSTVQREWQISTFGEANKL